MTQDPNEHTMHLHEQSMGPYPYKQPYLSILENSKITVGGDEGYFNESSSQFKVRRSVGVGVDIGADLGLLGRGKRGACQVEMKKVDLKL